MTNAELIKELQRYPMDAVVIKRKMGYFAIKGVKAHNNDLVRKGNLIRKYKEWKSDKEPGSIKLGFTHVIGLEIL